MSLFEVVACLVSGLVSAGSLTADLPPRHARQSESTARPIASEPAEWTEENFREFADATRREMFEAALDELKRSQS